MAGNMPRVAAMTFSVINGYIPMDLGLFVFGTIKSWKNCPLCWNKYEWNCPVSGNSLPHPLPNPLPQAGEGAKEKATQYDLAGEGAKVIGNSK
jgi:hypothetical protein